MNAQQRHKSYSAIITKQLLRICIKNADKTTATRLHPKLHISWVNTIPDMFISQIHAPKVGHAFLILGHGPIWQYASMDVLKLAMKRFYTKFGFEQSHMTGLFFFFLHLHFTKYLQTYFHRMNFEPETTQTHKASLSGVCQLQDSLN